MFLVYHDHQYLSTNKMHSIAVSMNISSAIPLVVYRLTLNHRFHTISGMARYAAERIVILVVAYPPGELKCLPNDRETPKSLTRLHFFVEVVKLGHEIKEHQLE